MTNLKDLFEGDIELYSLPDIYLRLRTVLDNPDFSLAEVAELVGQDPALSVRIMKLVNSAFFGFASPINTISHATSMLGSQQVHDLVLATSVTETFSGISSDVMDMHTFWRDSVFTGVLARILGTRCNVLDVDRLFVTGMLSNIGHLVMYQKLPQESQRALVCSVTEQRLIASVERDILGFDYADVGGELMQRWKISEALQLVVQQHTVPTIAEEYQFEVAIIHIASVISEAMRWPSAAQSWESLVDDSAWGLTQLSPNAMGPILDQAKIELASATDLILSDESRAA